MNLNVNTIDVHDLRESDENSLGAVQVLVSVMVGDAGPMQLIWQNSGDGDMYLCGREVDHDLEVVAQAVGVDGEDVWAVRDALSAVTADVQNAFNNWCEANIK